MGYGMTFRGTLRYGSDKDRSDAIDEAMALADPFFDKDQLRERSKHSLRLEYSSYSPATRWYDAMAQIGILTRPASGGWIDASFFGDEEERTRMLAGGHELTGEDANRRKPIPKPPPKKPKPPKSGYFLRHAIRLTNGARLTLEACAEALNETGWAVSPTGGTIELGGGYHDPYPDLLIVELGDGSLGIARWEPAKKRGGEVLRRLRQRVREAFGDRATIDPHGKQYVRGEWMWAPGFGPKRD